MQVARVQRWVISALILTTAFHFIAGMLIFAITLDRPDAFWVLTIISMIVALLSIAGVRVINEAPVLTPWLIVAALPAIVSFSFR